MGLELESRNIKVDPVSMTTNIEGVFAIGDVSTYTNKKKLILTGFHEGAVAAYSAQKYLYPDVKQSVQYTTTSSALQERLGVRDEIAARLHAPFQLLCSRRDIFPHRDRVLRTHIVVQRCTCSPAALTRALSCAPSSAPLPHSVTISTVSVGDHFGHFVQSPRRIRSLKGRPMSPKP